MLSGQTSLFGGVFFVSKSLLGGSPYKGQYREAPPENGTFFTLQVYEGYGFHECKYMKG